MRVCRLDIEFLSENGMAPVSEAYPWIVRRDVTERGSVDRR